MGHFKSALPGSGARTGSGRRRAAAAVAPIRFGARAEAVAERLDGSTVNAVRGGVFCKLSLHVDGSATAVVRALTCLRKSDVAPNLQVIPPFKL